MREKDCPVLGQQIHMQTAAQTGSEGGTPGWSGTACHPFTVNTTEAIGRLRRVLVEGGRESHEPTVGPVFPPAHTGDRGHFSRAPW